MSKNITVTKADGTKEPFDEDKLRNSLRRAGAEASQIDDIVDHITQKELKDGIKTSSIYRHARTLLKKKNASTAARYSLRQALNDLGPTGYPFEHFIARIFEEKGYEIEVGKELEGQCTDHEVDVVGRSEDTFVIGEAKFHNKKGVKSDVKTALYVKARFDDLKGTQYGGANQDGHTPRKILITNTKFTKRAITYGECAGLELIGWNHPESGNLQDLIEEANLQPVTALTSLSSGEKEKLVNNELVMCKNLRENRKRLEEIGMSDEKIDQVLEEVEGVCHL